MDRGSAAVLCILLALAGLAGRPETACGQSRAGAGVYAGYDLDYEAPLIGLTARFRTRDALTFSANLEYMPRAGRDVEEAQVRVVQLDLTGLLPLARRGPLSVWGGGGPALRHVRVGTRRDAAVEGEDDLRLGFSGVGEMRLRVFGPLSVSAGVTATLGAPTRTRLKGGLLILVPL